MMKKGLYNSIVEELNKLPWKVIYKNYCSTNGRYYYLGYSQIKLDKNKLKEIISHNIFKYCSNYVNKHPLGYDELIDLFNINISWTSRGYKAVIEYKGENIYRETFYDIQKRESRQSYQQASKYLTKTKLKK